MLKENGIGNVSLLDSSLPSCLISRLGGVLINYSKGLIDRSRRAIDCDSSYSSLTVAICHSPINILLFTYSLFLFVFLFAPSLMLTSLTTETLFAINKILSPPGSDSSTHFICKCYQHIFSRIFKLGI